MQRVILEHFIVCFPQFIYFYFQFLHIYFTILSIISILINLLLDSQFFPIPTTFVYFSSILSFFFLIFFFYLSLFLSSSFSCTNSPSTNIFTEDPDIENWTKVSIAKRIKVCSREEIVLYLVPSFLNASSHIPSQ